MIKLIKLKIANQVRRKKAFENRNQLYEYIDKNPGHTTYELAKKFNWTVGKTDYYIKKLLKDGIIKNSEEIVNGRLRKKYRAVDWKELLDWDEIKDVPYDKNKGKF